MKGIKGLGVTSVLVFGLVLGACAPRVESTTGQPVVSGVEKVDVTLAAVERSLTLGMQLANLYTSLPRCGSVGATVVCSSKNVVIQIRKAAIKAHEALLAARRNQELIGFAVNAVNYFTAVVPKS